MAAVPNEEHNATVPTEGKGSFLIDGCVNADPGCQRRGNTCESKAAAVQGLSLWQAGRHPGQIAEAISLGFEGEFTMLLCGPQGYH
jgi:hypothetical protein